MDRNKIDKPLAEASQAMQNVEGELDAWRANHPGEVVPQALWDKCEATNKAYRLAIKNSFRDEA